MVAVTSLSFFPLATMAKSTWSTAQSIDLTAGQTIIYDQLSAEGGNDFFRLTVSQPTTIDVEIGAPDLAGDFQPRLVFYQPDSQTIGPSLPMEQPPRTLALVYPASQNEPVFNAFTQISYRQKLHSTFDLVAGTTYLSVYNAASIPGRYRLSIDQGQGAVPSLTDAWQLLPHWWHDQAFAGLTWRTLLTPGLLIVLIVLVIEQLRFYHLHHLAVSRPTPSPRKKKKS